MNKLKPSNLAYLLATILLMAPALAVGQDEEKNPDKKIDLDSLFEQADEARLSGKFEEAAKKYRQYTDAKADNGAAWHYLGYTLHMAGKLDEAIPAHKKTTEFEDFRGIALYNLGCAYSLKNDPDQSIKYLHQSLDAGFNLLDNFAEDSDLVNVRKSKKYKQIQARVDNGGKRPKQKPKAAGFVGKWKVKSGTRQGKEVAADRLPPEITVTEKDLTMPAGEDAFVMSYKVVSKKKKIVAVDFKIEKGPAPEGTALGILKIEGNKATLCYDPTGTDRPKEFKTTEENGFFLFEMEKIQPKFDASKIIGKWKVTSGVRAGADVGKERLAGTIKLEKGKITIPAGEDEFVMSYEVNADKSPVQIDMKILSGPAPEGTPAVGIIEFQNGKFLLCYNAMGAERPEKFESTKENGFFFFTMKAEKE